MLILVDTHATYIDDISNSSGKFWMTALEPHGPVTAPGRFLPASSSQLLLAGSEPWLPFSLLPAEGEVPRYSSPNQASVPAAVIVKLINGVELIRMQSERRPRLVAAIPG